MERTVDYRTAHCTYIWAIENASKLHLSKSFRSPTFAADSEVMEDTKWQLIMELGMEYMTIFTRRIENDGGPNMIDVDYEISLLSAEGYPLVKMMDRKQFKNSSNYVLRRFAKTDEVYDVRKEEFLPKDTLTIQCRIWRKNLGISKVDLHYFHTQKNLDRVSFVWSIRNFSTLRLDEKRTHYVNPITERVPELTATFYLVKNEGKESLFMDFDVGTASNQILGRVSILDANGKVYHIIQIDESFYRNFLSKVVYPKNKIMANKESLLPNDVLTLKCEFEIDTELSCSQIEQYKYFDSTISECITFGVPEIQFLDEPETSCAASALQTFFIGNFKDGMFSDVCLRAGTESFPAHRLILSAFSPVFRTMFTTDMIEKKKGFVDITDVDPDTLSMLLSHIYTNTLPRLQWKSAVDLFIAADKYEITDLRDKCSDFLKSNLTLSNCCTILDMADKHHEQNLRLSVHGFMVKHQTEIFKSDMWKAFKSENFSLATHTLERIISLMKNTDD